MKIQVALFQGEQSRTFDLKGRSGWAMVQLIEASAKGVTPITRPASRWSAYVFYLRDLGIRIETIREPYEGNYTGTHARYVLTYGAEVQLPGTEVWI